MTYTNILKRKYMVKVSDEIYCTSTGHYFAKVWISDGATRDKRDIDLDGCRIMWKDKPFTYNGYPKYITQAIADGLKEKWDNGELSVYEFDRDGNRRYQQLRYHDPHRLQWQINYNFKLYGSDED